MGLKMRSDAAPQSPRPAEPPTWPSFDFEPRRCSLSPKERARRVPMGLKVRVGSRPAISSCRT